LSFDFAHDPEFAEGLKINPSTRRKVTLSKPVPTGASKPKADISRKTREISGLIRLATGSPSKMCHFIFRRDQEV